MSLTFYYGSGSPYAWKVWLTLEHKAIPYEFRLLSFDRGDTKAPAFLDVNPRGRVPTFVDDISVVVACALAEEWHGTINVATPRATTIRELAETIGYTIGVKPTFKRNDRTPVNIVPCLGRLRARFNVDRFTPLSEGIRQTVAAR